MLITGLVVVILLVVCNIFLWRTALSGISFFFVVYKDEKDTKNLKTLTHLTFTLTICGLLFLGGLITHLMLV